METVHVLNIYSPQEEVTLEKAQYRANELYGIYIHPWLFKEGPVTYEIITGHFHKLVIAPLVITAQHCNNTNMYLSRHKNVAHAYTQQTYPHCKRAKTEVVEHLNSPLVKQTANLPIELLVSRSPEYNNSCFHNTGLAISSPPLVVATVASQNVCLAKFPLL